MSKLIYKPKGKAGEYAQWACNIYLGCSNNCTYCYLKRGVLAHKMGGHVPVLRTGFRADSDALLCFEKELKSDVVRLQSIRKHGIFLSFTTDPFLPEVINSTVGVVGICQLLDVPVVLLTKRVGWYQELTKVISKHWLVAFGFTITGYDNLEPNASKNSDRISMMQFLAAKGFATWVSMEPVIGIQTAYSIWRRMVIDAVANQRPRLVRIGLMSGGQKLAQSSVREFCDHIANDSSRYRQPVYFKDSLYKSSGLVRNDYVGYHYLVEKDFDVFAGYKQTQ